MNHIVPWLWLAIMRSLVDVEDIHDKVRGVHRRVLFFQVLGMLTVFFRIRSFFFFCQFRLRVCGRLLSIFCCWFFEFFSGFVYFGIALNHNLWSQLTVVWVVTSLFDCVCCFEWYRGKKYDRGMKTPSIFSTNNQNNDDQPINKYNILGNYIDLTSTTWLWSNNNARTVNDQIKLLHCCA